MSNEPKRQFEIDRKIGKIAGQFNAITAELGRALHQEWALEELLQEYYNLLQVFSAYHAFPYHLGDKKRVLEERAEELGISGHRKVKREEHKA